MDESVQKRSSRACDECKVKRMKCDDIRDLETGQQSCKSCRDLGLTCAFNAPVRKRGPAVGFKKRRRTSQSADQSRETEISPVIKVNDISVTQPGSSPTKAPVASGSRPPSPGSSNHRSRSASRAPISRDGPFLGLPRPMIDELLAVYFTHVHNVWPLIYKPAFTPYNASPLLLLSMLAISACISPPSAASGFDARKLYRMAESALHRSRMDNRIDVVQALILLSLTQTGCGDKGAAFIYASRAVGMILNMGLNLARKDDSLPVDEQTRSRVLWNCYVLDKSLAEETGRSYLLPYRRCSTPFPSVDEVDELEVWPPASTSSAPLPRCVRRLTPRRGHVISCFIWTCRLAMVVEDILDLDSAASPVSDEWDRQFRESTRAKRGANSEEQEAERIGEQLTLWRQMLPAHLNVGERVSPLPHHVIGLAWHATATIMLHSRFVVRQPPSSDALRIQSDWAARAHAICSDAARQTVQMLRSLDKFGLLEQISSDVIHILSLATLFDAFDMTSPDLQVAARAKEDFGQCCTWLRLFSSSWPAASAHKLFFEAVIQGGLKLADPEAGNEDQASPLRHMADLPSPSLTGGLQAVRRHLSVSNTSNVRPSLSDAESGGGGGGGMAAEMGLGMGGASGMLQLPHFFWNHLSNNTVSGNPIGGGNALFGGPEENWDELFNFGDMTDFQSTNIEPDSWLAQPPPNDEHANVNTGAFEGQDPGWMMPNASVAGGATGGAVGAGSNSMPFTMGANTPINMRADQAAISAALMSFMADMTKHA